MPSERAAILDSSCYKQRLDFSFGKSEFLFKDLSSVFGQFRRGVFDLDRVVREWCKSRGHIDFAARLETHRGEESALAVLHVAGNVLHVHHRRREQSKSARGLCSLSSSEEHT